MRSTQNDPGEEYVRLALALESYIPGYVDAYFGPAEWKQQAQAEAPYPLAELEKRLDRLAELVAQGTDLDPQRQDYLSKQVRAMQASLLITKDQTLSLAEEAQALFDITPTWADEAKFEEAHLILEELLPPGDSLYERMNLRKKAAEISVERAQQILPDIVRHLRELTRRYFTLPEGEDFELRFVKDKPWSAYNWFMGSGQSLIEINTDLPLYVTHLADLIAHEGYPGHHTELSNKEVRLFFQAGRPEHSIAVLLGPSAVISEGIATYALKILMNDEEQAEWNASEVYSRAGFAHIDAPRELQIQRAIDLLDGVATNAAFLLHDQGAAEQDVIEYIRKYKLNREVEARKTLAFISNPLYRAYIFTYNYGCDLLEGLFTKVGNPREWFNRLLTEPVTPSQIRRWSEEEAKN